MGQNNGHNVPDNMNMEKKKSVFPLLHPVFTK